MCCKFKFTLCESIISFIIKWFFNERVKWCVNWFGTCFIQNYLFHGQQWSEPSIGFFSNSIAIVNNLQFIFSSSLTIINTLDQGQMIFYSICLIRISYFQHGGSAFVVSTLVCKAVKSTWGLRNEQKRSYNSKNATMSHKLS